MSSEQAECSTCWQQFGMTMTGDQNSSKWQHKCSPRICWKKTISAWLAIWKDHSNKIYWDLQCLAIRCTQSNLSTLEAFLICSKLTVVSCLTHIGPTLCPPMYCHNSQVIRMFYGWGEADNVHQTPSQTLYPKECMITKKSLVVHCLMSRWQQDFLRTCSPRSKQYRPCV